jgi:glutathione S-transferase
MLTLYHSPRSRSSRVIWLLEELGAEYDLQYVNIGRRTGDSVPDARNPNLLKQTPTIVHHGQVLHETVIIWIYLTDLYPQASMAPRVGDLRRAEYLAWLGLYNAVLEPVVTASFAPEGMSALQKAAYDALVAQWRWARPSARWTSCSRRC